MSRNGPPLRYDTLFLTISNYFMCFSDFPPAAGEPVRYWSKRESRAARTNKATRVDAPE